MNFIDIHISKASTSAIYISSCKDYVHIHNGTQDLCRMAEVVMPAPHLATIKIRISSQAKLRRKIGLSFFQESFMSLSTSISPKNKIISFRLG